MTQQSKRLSALITMLLCVVMSAVAATSFSLSTTKGSSFTLWLNDGITADLSWDDGTTATLAPGTVYTATAPGSKLTVKVADGDVTAIVCPASGITAITGLASLTKLQVLWLPDNALTELDLSKQRQLNNLVVSGNALESLTLASDELRHVWVNDNQLSGTLDLSTAKGLITLAADNNDYSLIKLNASSASKKTLTDFYAHNNALWFNSFPTIYNTSTEKYSVAAVVVPQRPFHAFDYKLLNEPYDASDLFRYNAWNAALTEEITFIAPDGHELVSGEDFTKSSYTYTFLKENREVVAQGTSRYYPDVTLRTAPMSFVADATGIIGQQTTDDRQAPIYDLQGRRLLPSSLSPSASGVSPKSSGLYIHNGRKILK